MAVGLVYDCASDLGRFLRVAREADSEGIDSVWIGESVANRDSLVAATLVASGLHRCRVIPGPLSPYSRHPVTIARSLLSLSEIAPHRVALHLGVGNLRSQAAAGIPARRSAEAMWEALAIIGGICKGEHGPWAGSSWQIESLTLGIRPTAPIPIYLAAMGPRMLRLASTKADGVVLSDALSPEYLRDFLSSARPAIEERRRTGFLVTAFVVACTMDASADAYQLMKPVLGRLLGRPSLHPAHVADWKINELAIEKDKLEVAAARQDAAELSALVPDRAVEVLTATGTPREFERRLATYMTAGVDLLAIAPIGDEETKIRTLRLACAVCRK
jgi:5,10-methylenetetrahydromethanopterin reductase